MTPAEFEAFLKRSIHGYAEAHARAGDWERDEAEERAQNETHQLLPEGLETPGMLFVIAESPVGVVGSAWVALKGGDRGGAWIYDIEVVPEQRGRGYGRALLEALEQEVERHGADTLGLNVFGENHVARKLYESADYEVTSMHMRKRLT